MAHWESFRGHLWISALWSRWNQFSQNFNGPFDERVMASSKLSKAISKPEHNSVTINRVGWARFIIKCKSLVVHMNCFLWRLSELGERLPLWSWVMEFTKKFLVKTVILALWTGLKFIMSEREICWSSLKGSRLLFLAVSCSLLDM